jgi:hypothetical protein
VAAGVALPGADPPAADRLRQDTALQERLTRPNRQLVHVVDLQVVRAVEGGKSFLRPAIVVWFSAAPLLAQAESESVNILEST